MVSLSLRVQPALEKKKIEINSVYKIRLALFSGFIVLPPLEKLTVFGPCSVLFFPVLEQERCQKMDKRTFPQGINRSC